MKILVAITLLALSITVNAQEAKIILKNGNEMTTMITASSNSQFFTKEEPVKFEAIQRIVFKENDSKYQGIYDKLDKANIPYSFDDSLVYHRDENQTALEALFKSKNEDYPENLPFTEDGKLMLEEVVEMEGVSADDLYSRARLFFTETFKSANDVVQLDDALNHTIVGKGLSKEYIKSEFLGGTEYTDQTIHYTIKIQTKEGRYRYVIDNLYSTTPGYNIENNPTHTLSKSGWEKQKKGKWLTRMSKNYYDEITRNFKETLEGLRLSITTAMEKSIVDADW